MAFQGATHGARLAPRRGIQGREVSGDETDRSAHEQSAGTRWWRMRSMSATSDAGKSTCLQSWAPRRDVTHAVWVWAATP